jgi:hypothetical protein
MQNNSIKVPFVWTEIGRKPGKYVLNAININAELFPDQPRFLILSQEFASKIKLSECEIIYEENLVSTENSIQFQSTPKNWSWSQANYWTNTTRRFFVLEQFLRSFGLKQLIHLESDTVLLDKNYIDGLFNDPSWGIKYTKQDSNTGCASVFLVNSIDNLSDFNRFIIENWENPASTDMTLLSEYHTLKSKNSYLPSGDLIETNTIFDAGTIGRYYLGGDARNNRMPFSTRGLLPSTPQFFNPIEYHAESDGLNLKLIDSHGNELSLACVHIHSKRIPRNIAKLIKSIVKESNAKRNILWKTGALDFGVINERIKSFLQRRLLRNKTADPRVR